MADLPVGTWTEKADDGRVKIMHTNDAGQPYVARQCENAEVRPHDVDALALGDRERTTAREFVQHFIEHKEKADRDFDNRAMDELTEAALPVAEAGCGHRQFSMSAAYERGERYFAWKRQLELEGKL